MACSILPVKIKISAHDPRPYATFVRSSKAEGPLRRPMAPSPPAPPSLAPAPAPSPSPPKPLEPAAATGARGGVVTLEYQRKMAKEMQEYFRQKKLEEAEQGPFFGFLGKNEIANGRWAMFGFAVGLLTEYATGADLVQQLKILFSNFGIVDLD
uniref:Photosystem II protein, chloroplastic n=1 Tax=Anthurium amnicola TaxID=1678845 RepID=A0A1D1XHU7_9ARAE